MYIPWITVALYTTLLNTVVAEWSISRRCFS